MFVSVTLFPSSVEANEAAKLAAVHSVFASQLKNSELREPESFIIGYSKHD